MVSHVLPFLYRFHHDLSLVTSKNLPSIISTAGTPTIVGWGEYHDALDGRPLFVAGLNAVTGNLIKRSRFYDSIIGPPAIAEGTEYLWDKRTLSHSISILWRTEHNEDSLKGLSGSVLCLGQPHDRTCLAVCFPNFEYPLYSRKFKISVSQRWFSTSERS